MVKKEAQVMTKRVKSLVFIGIFVLCLALVFAVLVLTQPGGDEVDAKENEKISVLNGDKDNVAKMTIKNETGEYTIAQNAKGFYVEELGGLNQNSTVLSAAGNCASAVKAQAVVEEKAENFEKYGLSDENPSASVFVTLKDGMSYTLLFGIDSPDGKTVYMRLKDSDKVYAVLSSSSRYFYYDKESFISLVVLNQIASESVAPTIDRMTVTRKDLDYDIIFVDDSKNYATGDVAMASSQVMISPVYAYLDIVNSNAIMYGLWGLTAEGAVVSFPTEEDFAEYGLDDPFCTVELNAELQTYKLLIGNVAAYAKDANGSDTTEALSYYGYFEGIDAIFVFSAPSVPWASFMPIDILSSMMTSNYIYMLDYIDIDLHNGEDIRYYFDITGDVDAGILECSLDGKPVNIDDFKIMYQFILKCPIDDICLTDPDEGAKLLCRIDFKRIDEGGDILEFYDDGSNRVIIKLNGTTSFSQPKSYLDVLCSNLKIFAEGASGDDLMMIW